MKKLTFCMLATFFVLSAIPTQLKAAVESITTAISSTSDIKTAGTNVDANRLNEIKSIDLSALSTTENKDILKEAGTNKNDQDEHSRRYRNRHQQRNVDVTITSGRQARGDGYYEGRHGNGGTYLGVGGVLIIILILVLVL